MADYNIARAIEIFKAASKPYRHIDETFSPVINEPTTENVLVDLAAGIKQHHAEQVARENHFYGSELED